MKKKGGDVSGEAMRPRKGRKKDTLHEDKEFFSFGKVLSWCPTKKRRGGARWGETCGWVRYSIVKEKKEREGG